jgi:hypothetical protein
MAGSSSSQFEDPNNSASPAAIPARIRLCARRKSWRTEETAVRRRLCRIGRQKPAEISHELITGIRAREADGAISGALPATAIFAPGDQVMVADGPFASLIGTVERVPKIAIADLSVPTRLKLTLDIFGRTTRVDVPLSAIRNVRVRRLAAKPFPTRPEALSQ